MNPHLMSLLSGERHNFKHLDRVIYEWDQTLTEVNVYIQVPTGVTAKQLSVEIAPTSLKVGLKSNPPYVQVVKKITLFPPSIP